MSTDGLHSSNAQRPQEELLAVLEDARWRVALAGNDFAYSSWEGPEDALAEIDSLIGRLRGGDLPWSDLEVVFGATGPLQELAMSSGWGQAFLDLAARFDSALQAHVAHAAC